MNGSLPPIREGGCKRGGVKPVPTTPKPDVAPGSQSTAKPQGSIPDTPDPRPDLTPDALRVDWELDIENEQLEGGEEKLASLIFTSAAGQMKIDNFTPDALCAIADQLLEHAADMNGLDGCSREDLKALLVRCHRYLGCYPYEVPDGLRGDVEIAADINRPDVFDNEDSA